jgi:phosphotransacetylase
MTKSNSVEDVLLFTESQLKHFGLIEIPLAQTGNVLPKQGYLAGARMEKALRESRSSQDEMRNISALITEEIVSLLADLESRLDDPRDCDNYRQFLERLLPVVREFNREKELVTIYGQLLTAYITTLYRSGSVGRSSDLIGLILRNIARRKAIELERTRIEGSFPDLSGIVSIAIIAKRYGVYVLVTRGFTVLFRNEIDFRTHGNSPQDLALIITGLLLRNGVRLSDVTEVVCAGGDLGPLPDGIYVLTEKIRDESLKNLQNSSLNRSALVAWELVQLLRKQGVDGRINSSVCSPLSFATIASHEISHLFRRESRELSLSLRGYVKVMPLKAIAAVLSELLQINQDNLNLLVMTLDDLFASVVRKTGPTIVREMATQDSNRMLLDFDFTRISDYLALENFKMPQDFRLASREIGTGAKEICELIMIVESGKISQRLSTDLLRVVDTYARQVAMVLGMASAGQSRERPSYTAVSSARSTDPYFRRLFGKIRENMDNPFTALLCVDSLEHEYLIANHLFELYVNPTKGDRRLNQSVESQSITRAIQVLNSSGKDSQAFSFHQLLAHVTDSISQKRLGPANLVLVGADNEDALIAVSSAKDQGLLNRIALIGDPTEIRDSIKRCSLSLSPNLDSSVQVITTDPLAVDGESKDKSIAEVFRSFLEAHPDYVVVKGSVNTASLLHQALSIYRTPADQGTDGKPVRKIATSTAIFVLPDSRFFALSDAAVNPSFRNSEQLLQAIENQVDVVRRVVHPGQILKVAIITAVEKETAAIPSTLVAAETELKASELLTKYAPMVVEGPLSFDLATVPDAAVEKHYQGQIKGDANCFVATDINTANVLYKMLSKTMGNLGLMIDNGAIITAGPGTVPIVLTSRGDTAQTKFNSILLAMAYSAGVGASYAENGG